MIFFDNFIYIYIKLNNRHVLKNSLLERKYALKLFTITLQNTHIWLSYISLATGCNYSIDVYVFV